MILPSRRKARITALNTIKVSTISDGIFPWWRNVVCATTLAVTCQPAGATAPDSIPHHPTIKPVSGAPVPNDGPMSSLAPWSQAKLVRDSYDGLDWRDPADRSQPEIQPIPSQAANTGPITHPTPRPPVAPPASNDVARPNPPSGLAAPSTNVPHLVTLQPAHPSASVKSVLLRQPTDAREIARSVTRDELEPLPLAPHPATMQALAKRQQMRTATSEPAAIAHSKPRDTIQANLLDTHLSGTNLSDAEETHSPQQRQPATTVSHQQPAKIVVTAGRDLAFQADEIDQVAATSDATTTSSSNDGTHSILVAPAEETEDPETITSMADQRSAAVSSRPEPQAKTVTDSAGVEPETIPPADRQPTLAIQSPDTMTPDENSDANNEPAKNDLCERNNRSCQEAWDLVHQVQLSEISLDTTPPYEPGEKDRALANKHRATKLAEEEFRTWRDRDGQALAEGQLQDYKFGKLTILGTDGQQQQIPALNLSDEDSCYLAQVWNFPASCRFGNTQYEPRNWHLLTFTWTASALCHKPLYFEDVSFERCGHTAGPVVQPFLSGAHFFGNVLMLPYNVGLHSPTECIYSLGYYRPGSCAPWHLHALPISARAIRFQASAVLGISAFLP